MGDATLVMRGIVWWLEDISNTETNSSLRPTIFHSQIKPLIMIGDYVTHLRKYGKFSANEFVVALIYVRRITSSHPLIDFASLSVHRLLVSALLVATKMYKDNHLSNRYYAKVGGLVTRELDRLERCILELLDFRLYVSAEEFETENEKWSQVELESFH